MRVGIVTEVLPGERRVAATPETVKKIKKLGWDVLVQSGAGGAADIDDSSYVEAGAEIGADAASVWREADLMLKVRAPAKLADGTDEASLLKEGGRLIGFVWPAQNKELVERLAARKATVFAMDAMPRITRAQKMDALSAMANIVGYRAVIEAASHYGAFFPGQMTAAGKVRPATVLIVGAGVAGLAAIAAARSLGAIVRAFDTRPVVREQIESLGAAFIDFKFEESGEGVGGYAKEMSAAFLKAEQDLLAKEAASADIVITTALIPGKPAPQLITAEAVQGMRRGSVVVDLAAEQGGNCPLTEADKVVVKHGVTLVGFTDHASRMARTSSELYATTVYNLLEELIDKETHVFAPKLEDEAHRGAIILDHGKLMWPPPVFEKPKPAAPVVAKPAPAAPAPAAKSSSKGHGHSSGSSEQGGGMIVALLVLGALLGLAGAFGGPEFLQHFTVFLLACVAGWQVVWNVAPALHTPLMSVTNAISGIILIGGVLLMRGGGITAPIVLAAVAILVASINVAGGFLVTQRMLRMFRR